MKEKLKYIALVFTVIFVWVVFISFIIVLIFGTEKYTFLKTIDGYFRSPFVDLAMIISLFFLLSQYPKK